MAPILQFSFGFICLILVFLPTTGAKDDSLSQSVPPNNSRCRAIRYEMPVKKEGCFKREIQAYYCAGSCLSAFIPGSYSLDLGVCGLCQPTKQVKIQVPLLCAKKGRLYTTIEEVSVIEACGCRTKEKPCKRKITE